MQDGGVNTYIELLPARTCLSFLQEAWEPRGLGLTQRLKLFAVSQDMLALCLTFIIAHLAS